MSVTQETPEAQSASRHSVFVLAADGTPLTPTTPQRARVLLRAGQASPVWSALNTFGIRLRSSTRSATPRCAVGVDHGSVAEGYAVVCGAENVLAVKLDLPDKRQIVRKMTKRRQLRQARRFRLRRRPCRCQNRKRRPDWLAPSQGVVVASRLKILRALTAMYPVTLAGIEDVRFDHLRHRWGATFSTVEVGKARIGLFLEGKGINISLYRGYETKVLREEYGYRKASDKRADRFEAHCSDALALACAVAVGARVSPGPWLVVDDTYRPVRRQLHDMQPDKGGVRAPYSRGTVQGYRKGVRIGTPAGKVGRLCGFCKRGFLYYDAAGKRQSTTRLAWVSARLITRPGAPVGT
jgi:RRXRR protein